MRCWVSQATLHRKLGDTDAAVALLRRAAKAEPRVEEAYLTPLLAEMAGEGQQGAAHQGQLAEALQEALPEEQPAAERQGGK